MADAQLRLRGKDETKAAFSSVLGSIRSLKVAASGVQGLFAGIFAGFSAAAITSSFKSVIDSADQMSKAAQKVGVMTEDLSALQYAADLSGVAFEALSASLAKLSKNAAEAAIDTGDAKDAFKALGIEVKAAEGGLKSTDALLLEIADKFEGFEDSAEKTALAIKLFGRSGAELIPFLNLGRAGIAELRKEAERLGIVLSADAGKAAEQFNDDITRLQASVRGVQQAILSGLIPPLNDLVNAFRATSVETEKWKDVGRDIGEIFKTIAISAQYTASFVQALGNTIGGFAAAASEALSGLSGARRAPGILREMYAENERINKLLQERVDLIRSAGEQQRKAEDEAANKDAARKGKAPGLFDPAAAKKAADEAKKLAEEGTKSWIAAIEEMQRASDDMVYTWTVTGERIALTKDEFQEMERTAKKLADEDLRGMFDAIEKMVEESDNLVYTWTKFGERIAITREEWDLQQKELEELDKAAEDFGLTLSSAFSDAVIEGKKFSDIMKAILKDLLQIVARETVLKPLAKVFTDIIKVITGGGKGGGSIFGDIFSGGRAAGGPVSSGRAYMVGERGPELFVPGASGSIVPSAGGVNITVNVDASGAGGGDPAQTGRTIGALVADAVRREIVEQQRFGGLLAA